MKKLEKMAANVVNSMIGIETYGWPPVCIGMLYQPERPKKRPEKSLLADSSKKHIAEP